MNIRLKINEIFKSIQGESSFAGIPFIFIRLSGCSLRCSYCDTAYAFHEGEEKTIEEILMQISGMSCSHVLVTGGEPLDQPGCRILIKELLDHPYTVLVETAGCHLIRDYPRGAHYIVDIKTPSSNMSHKNNPALIEDISKKDEIKFVIGNREDYEFSKRFIQENQLSGRCGTILMSCVSQELEPRILAEWILADNLDVRMQLQLHKYIWPPHQKGV
ncbi:MAG: radical SAM protein [Candidatus Aureabacteria bacterium]|nr:radical SAM protein [Candidatus Auribacterota bacterium]